VTDRKVTFNNHFETTLTPFWCHHDCLFCLGTALKNASNCISRYLSMIRIFRANVCL